MRIKKLIYIVAIALASCNITEDQSTPVPVPASTDLVDELRKVMSMPLGSPSDKLKKVITYGGNSDIVHVTREIHYPSVGSITYHVIRDQNQDTVAVGLNYFKAEDMVETSILFPFHNGPPIWQSTREYAYNTENLLETIYLTSDPIGRRLLAQYRYNSQKLLTQIDYPFDGGAELKVYSYDDQGRISGEWTTSQGQEEAKIDYLVHRYGDEGLLEAKEAEIYGVLNGKRQDAFQYFYDGQGKLVLLKEFDPHFGFQQKYSSEFFYHEGNQ